MRSAWSVKMPRTAARSSPLRWKPCGSRSHGIHGIHQSHPGVKTERDVTFETKYQHGKYVWNSFHVLSSSGWYYKYIYIVRSENDKDIRSFFYRTCDSSIFFRFLWSNISIPCAPWQARQLEEVTLAHEDLRLRHANCEQDRSSKMTGQGDASGR